MTKERAPKAPHGWKNVGVELPDSVCKIILAAGGADPANGGMPRAMASIVGALPWIAAVLHKALPDDEYRAFAQQLKENMQIVWTIAGAENPSTAFDEAFANAKKQVN